MEFRDESEEGSDAGSTSAATRVLVLDDHPVLAVGVETLLQKQPGFEVVGVLNSVAELSEFDEPWDVIVLDLKLDDGNGMQLLDEIVDKYEHRHAVIYSVLPPDQVGVSALSHGASSYISKSEDAKLLITAVEHASRGERYITPKLADRLIATDGAQLTERETETVRLLTAGIRPSKIAEELGVTRSTVSGHLASAREKLDAESNVELVRVFEHGNG
jgi:DNA-binding NarL/FixJ family response regulator